MISKHTIRKYCSEDISKIENYEQACNDKTQIWDCHHRAEILPCGVYTLNDLKKFGLYFNRPASELTFMPHSLHMQLHLKGKPLSIKTRCKMSNAKKGKQSPRKGVHLSEETKQKLRDANLGKKHSQETKMKMSASAKGKNTWAKGRHWYNNGIVTVGAYECPEGFVPGRLKKE